LVEIDIKRIINNKLPPLKSLGLESFF